MKETVIKIEKYLEKNKTFNNELEYFYFHKKRYEYILKLLKESDKNSKILDVGFAYLHLLIGFKKAGFSRLYGTDKWEPDTVLNKRGEEFNIKIMRVDLEKNRFSFNDNYFDIIIFTEVLEHLNFYPGPIFKEFSRILKRGGKLILTTPNLTRLNNRIKMLIGKSIHPDIHCDYSIGPHFREYTASELKYLTEQGGVKVDKIHYVDFYYPGLPFFTRLVNKFLGWLMPNLKGNIVLIGEK